MLHEMCDLAETYGAKVIAITPQPTEGTSAAIDAERQWLAAQLTAMAATGRIAVCDVRTAMTAVLGAAQETWKTGYGWEVSSPLHWSEAGVAAVAPVLAASIVAIK